MFRLVSVVLLTIFNLQSECALAQSTIPQKSFAEAYAFLLRSADYQATESELRSVELDFASREIVLEPYVELIGRRANEGRETVNNAVVRKTRVDTISGKLGKPFSTGTRLEVGPAWENALLPSLDPDRRGTMDWQITLTQSLWQDGFGRSTRLRRARENFQRQGRLAEVLGRRAQLVYDFESLYWDWAQALREAELQEKNLKRSRQILSWVQDRFRRSAAESTDLLQAQALTKLRELQVATLQQSLTQAWTRVERFMPGRAFQPRPDDLAVARPIDSLTVKWNYGDRLSQVVPLKAIEAENEALAAAEAAREAREDIRPELNLELGYGRNAIDPSGDAALRQAFDENHENSSIGLVFRTGLDLGNEQRRVDSSRAAAEAAERRRLASRAESAIAWTQLQTELKDLDSRLQSARELVDLQTRKANAERERYRKGRSTAFQAITFEQEVAEAEITLWQLYALMRKTEARARLFAR